ncbi:DNA primase [Flavobacterium amnicola]|uniref:DNA primase n=1 Tax=Flavobacterium amnicola TaxID=2506422 RepID=A0A4Q1K0D2_9FLAO|nr:DNA primase [Flavobacterium amnicola]RXR17272.1 DNA primase [Flavobacterium amnicola]
MKRVIVDYSKLTGEILNLLVDKFPDGYDDSDIVRFKNAKNETIEAVEVKTEDTIYLVKVSTKLADRIENYDEDDELENGAEDSLDALKELEIDDDTAADEEKLEKGDADDADDDDDEDDDDVADSDVDDEDE